MAELSASMARRTITATISDLYEAYTGGRTFHWYLDGVLVRSESTMSTDTSRTYTFNGVPYLAQHTVYLVVNNYEDTECFDTFTATVDDTMHLWSWSASNGTATATQTRTAYTAITTRGRTRNFNYLVWNDLVETLADVLTVWNPGYATISDVLMEASGSALTAERFNSVVQNIGNPWMFWAYQTDRKGYLGRLEVHGKAQYGAGKDKVYGAYLVELVKMLNVLIDAKGEFNAGYAALLGGHESTAGLYTSAYLPLRAPTGRHLSYDGAMYAYLNSLEFLAQPSCDMSRYTGNISFSANRPKLITPSARRLLHIGSSGLAWGYAQLKNPDSLRMICTANESLNPAIWAGLTTPPSARVKHTAAETLLSVLAATLDLDSASSMRHIGEVIATTTTGAALRTPDGTKLAFEGSHTTRYAAELILRWLVNADVLLYTAYQFLMGHGDPQAVESLLLHTSSQFMSGHPRPEALADVLLQSRRQFMEAHGETDTPIAALLHSQYQFLTAQGRAQELESVHLHSAPQFMSGQGRIRVPEDVLLHTAYQFMTGRGRNQSVEPVLLHSMYQFMSATPCVDMPADVLLHTQYQFMSGRGRAVPKLSALLYTAPQFLIGQGETQSVESILLFLQHQFLVGQGKTQAVEPVLMHSLDYFMAASGRVQDMERTFLHSSFQSMLGQGQSQQLSSILLHSLDDCFAVGQGRTQNIEDTLLHTLHQSMIGQPDAQAPVEVNLRAVWTRTNEASPRTDATEDLLLYQYLSDSNAAGHRVQTPSTTLLHLRRNAMQRYAAAQYQATANALLYLGPDGLRGQLASQTQTAGAVRLTTDRSEVHLAMGKATEPASIHLVTSEASWGMPGENVAPVRTLMFSSGGSLDRAGAGGYAVDPRKPVQTGSDLYIMAAYGVYQDGSVLHFVKDGVFFDPVQDESDLYIRSVTLIWMDGTEANVDRECFPEPIQTGSNLYIRHDVLGGE